MRDQDVSCQQMLTNSNWLSLLKWVLSFFVAAKIISLTSWFVSSIPIKRSKSAPCVYQGPSAVSDQLNQIGVYSNNLFAKMKDDRAMTCFVVITLLLLCAHIICVTTRGMLCVREECFKVHGLWKINSCIRFSEESSSQDVAVLQRLAQSANPAEPAVWCMWKDWKGNVGSVWAPFYGNLKESMTVTACLCFVEFWHNFFFAPGNWSLWGDQQSEYTWSRCNS